MHRFMISPLARVYAWELARHAEQLPLGQNKCFLGALCIVEGKPGPEGLHCDRNLRFSPKNDMGFAPSTYINNERSDLKYIKHLLKY